MLNIVDNIWKWQCSLMFSIDRGMRTHNIIALVVNDGNFHFQTEKGIHKCKVFFMFWQLIIIYPDSRTTVGIIRRTNRQKCSKYKNAFLQLEKKIVDCDIHSTIPDDDWNEEGGTNSSIHLSCFRETNLQSVTNIFFFLFGGKKILKQDLDRPILGEWTDHQIQHCRNNGFKVF